MCATWRIYVNDMTRFFVFFGSCSLPQSSMWQVPRINLWSDLLTFIWHISFTCVSWLIHIWHSFVLPDALMCVTTAPNKCVLWLIDMYVTWRIYMRVMTHSCLTFIWLTWRIHVFHTRPQIRCAICLINMCEMIHSYALTWLTHVCVKCSLLICVTCQIHTCDMTYSCVTWLMHMCYLTHTTVWLLLTDHTCDIFDPYVRYLSFSRVTWLIYVCYLTHSSAWQVLADYTCDILDPYVRCVLFTRVTWLIYMCYLRRSSVWMLPIMRVLWCIHAWDVSHSHVWHDSFIFFDKTHTCVTGARRP